MIKAKISNPNKMQFSNLSKIPKCMIEIISSYLDNGRLIKMDPKWFRMGYFLEDISPESSDCSSYIDPGIKFQEFKKSKYRNQKSESNFKRDIALMNRFDFPLEIRDRGRGKYNHFSIAVRNPELSNGIKSLRFINSNVKELVTRALITGFLDKMPQVSTIEFYYVYHQFQNRMMGDHRIILIEVLEHGKKLETLKMCFEVGSIGICMLKDYADSIFQRIPKLKMFEVRQRRLHKTDCFYPLKLVDCEDSEGMNITLLHHFEKM